MMLILAFDTTSEHGGAAIYRDLDCLASVDSDRAASYSMTLFQMVEQLVEEVRRQHAIPLLSLRDIELYAVANGPGSFTGIRVGLAAAQAWAKAFGRPVRGISILEAMVDEAHPEGDLAVPIIDARRGEFFLGTYRRAAVGDGTRFVAEGEGMVVRSEALGLSLEACLRSGATVTCLVREHDRAARDLPQRLSESLRWHTVTGTLLGAIARLALEAHRQGKLQSPAELDACYIRRSDAELNWRE